MRNGLKTIASSENLNRAYKWMQSNPDHYYKSFFRDSYNAYAVASRLNLKRLSRMILNGSYEPEHAGKIYIPKQSGILRPYTLLTVTDQIVYQACVNLIADKLKPKTKSRYEKNIFGNLYAGKSSPFFYIRWQRGYKKFKAATFSAVEKGYEYVANFDLTSFYDSIDHKVLEYFLDKIGIEKEVAELLLRCLKKWTCCTWSGKGNLIYHNHGIPQGPLPSGLLSELVLFYIDNKGITGTKSRYLRYVDDIKIFAKTEGVLRQKLISLDLASKEVGLFPQTAKINIRKVSSAEAETKNISSPDYYSGFKAVNQTAVITELLALSKRSKVKNEDMTRFKQLLAVANPSHKLNTRLIQILPSHPILSISISKYFADYAKLPDTAAKLIVNFLEGEEIYHSVHADLLNATLNNMPSPYQEKCITYCKKNIFNRHAKLPPPQPSYKAAALSWLVKKDAISYTEFKSVFDKETVWWIKKDILKHVSEDQFGKDNYTQLLNEALLDDNADVALMAAMLIADKNLDVKVSEPLINHWAFTTLFMSKKTRRFGSPPSLFVLTLPEITGTQIPSIDWRGLFGEDFEHAESMALTLKRGYEADINACLIHLDSVCNLIYEKLFNQVEPGKDFGSYGGMLCSTSMKQNYPLVCFSFNEIHDLRGDSHTTHPRKKRSLVRPRRLLHSDLKKIRPCLIDALNEISQKQISSAADLAIPIVSTVLPLFESVPNVFNNEPVFV